MIASGSTPGDAAEPTSTDELWARYKETGEESIRNILVERYLVLVRYQAERMAARLVRSVEVEDLVQEGYFGLTDAIEKFDPSLGFKFKTYCSQRIRGAIYDSLRSQDWVPRLTRTRSNKAERIRQRYQSEHGREPTNEELAEELELDVNALGKAQPRSMLSLSDRRPDGTDQRASIDTLGESKEQNPFDVVNRSDLMKVLTRSLNEKERQILQMYYLDGLNLREIGERMSLTESRVCQIHGNVIKRLKERLGDSAEDFGV